MGVILKDVAAKAGVSIAAASLALNGRGQELKLSQACIRRVVAAARALGYQSNYHARTLKTGRSMMLGVVHSGDRQSFLSHRFFATITAGIDRAARAQGYNLVLLGANKEIAPLDGAVDALEQRRIDALIVLGHEGALPPGAKPHRARIVNVNTPTLNKVAGVRFDPIPGLNEALAHLKSLGHRRILQLGASLNGREATPERRAALVAEAKRLGLALETRTVAVAHYMPELERNIAIDRAAIISILPLPGEFTAVVCYNDTMAVALMSLLIERGVRIPEQLSVIGFDDIHATVVVPPLTTVSHALGELGEAAVARALELIGGGDGKEAVVPSFLVMRASTGLASQP